MRTIVLILALLQSPEEIYKAANADFDAGRWMEAASKFEMVLKEDPSHIPSRFSLAVCYTKTGNTDGAIAAYRKILEQDPSVYEVRTNLGILLEDAGKRADAAEQFEKAVELRPDDAQARLNLGILYLRDSLTEKAYPHLIAAADKGLNTSELYIALSEVEDARKNEAKSRAWLEKASQLDPANRNVRTRLAISYFEMKDYAKAAPLLEEITQVEPPNVDYLYMLGKSYQELKAIPRAIATLQQIARMKPDYVEAYATLGAIYYGQEDWARAAQMLTRVVELRPRQALGHFVLATCLDNLGNPGEAALHYNKFLEYDDGSSDARSFQARQRAKTLERRLKR